MSNYIDKDYYYNTYAGNIIPQNEIEKYATSASNEVRLRIMNKNISNYETQVKNVTCSVAEILYNQNLKKQKINALLMGKSKIITSEKVDDYSKSYANISIGEMQKDIDSTNKKITEEIEKELLFTGLLYSGVIDVR